MGQSTDAYLFYGISADDEEDIDDIIKTLGFEPGECNDSFEALNQFLPDGLEQENHCSCDCPIPAICIASTKKWAWRGNPTRFDELPPVDEDLKRILTEYAEKLGWPAPSWMIASMWC
jgi:hypothetical protein